MYNESLSARIKRRNRSNNGQPIGNGNHTLFFPKEHYGQLPKKRRVSMKWNKKKECYEPRKRKDGSFVYETPRTSHILKMAAALFPVRGKHAGSKPLDRLSIRCGHAANAMRSPKA